MKLAATSRRRRRPRRPRRAPRRAGEARVTLIIGGGIAAYKALDLIRRLKERAHPCPLRADPRGAAIRHAACRPARSSGERAYHRPVRSRERVRCRPYPAGARLRPDRGGAGDRRPDGQDGQRPCRRSRHRRPARDRQADPAGARDEPAHVEQCRDPAQRRAAARATASPWSAPTPARWRKPAKPASAAWPSRPKSPRPPRALLRPAAPQPLAGKRVLITAGPTHEPIDPVRYIANRSSGKQGYAIAARRRRRRRRGDAGLRPGRSRRSAPA